MKKEELQKMTTPVSRKDYLILREALVQSEIERTDIPIDVRLEMDKLWAKDNEAIHEDYKRRGIFGEYD